MTIIKVSDMHKRDPRPLYKRYILDVYDTHKAWMVVSYRPIDGPHFHRVGGPALEHADGCKEWHRVPWWDRM